MEEFVLWMDHIPDLALYITLSIGCLLYTSDAADE